MFKIYFIINTAIEIVVFIILYRKRNKLSLMDKEMIKASLQTTEEILIFDSQQRDPALVADTLKTLDQLKDKL